MCLSSHLELDLQAKNTPMSSRLLVFMAESHQGCHRVNENDEKYLKKLPGSAPP
jgi:hypothetical protein